MEKTWMAILVLTIVWWLIGCVVLALIDDENGSLLKWADKAPYGIDMFFPIFFPVFLFYWIKRKAGGDDKSN